MRRSSRKNRSVPTRDRRSFLGGAASLAALPTAVWGWSPASLSGSTGTGEGRATRAWQMRQAAAEPQRQRSVPVHLTNGDEERYPNRLGSFSKTLPHDARGEVDRAAYQHYLDVLQSGVAEGFHHLPVGGAGRLTSPQAGLAYELIGSDASLFIQPPPPAFASAALVGEFLENCWMALTRDVHFSDYEIDPLTNAAAADLSRLPEFHGPRVPPASALVGGQSRGETDGRDHPVSPGTLFRGLTPGDLTGPYLSQFLWLDVPYGAETISRRIRTVLPGDDYLTGFGDWLTAQVNTGQRPLPNRYDPVRRYIRNGRDLGEWVHLDLIFQPFLNAALILLGLRAPVDENNPYVNSGSQIGFATFGPPHLLSLVTAVAGCALRTVWYQKWFVHRRLRPEEFGARVHNHLTGLARYPIDPSLFQSAAPVEIHRRFGSYLLPMAFPEGSPTHPAYGSGHAVIAGACATVLKAWFKEDWVLPHPVVADREGLSLLPWNGDSLTVGGELNKLAANNSFGRNIAGVHWRSDAVDSIRLGEAVAIAFLDDMAGCYNETFAGFTLTKFDGTQIRIGA
ncbi:MAG: vanadium-dependent haloperoxidase [Blastocatellia bacterium]